MRTPELTAHQVLAALPGADLPATTIADLTDTTIAEAHQELTALVTSHQATQTTPGRYRIADPFTAPEDHVIERVLDYHLAQAAACCKATNPWRWYVGPALATATDHPGVPGVERAREWMRSEFAVLALAVETAHTRGDHDRCWQLVETLKSEFTRSRHPDRVRLCDMGLEAARACHNSAAQAMLALMLAQALLDRGETDQAITQVTQAQQIAGHDHPQIMASSWETLGLAHHRAGRLDEAEHAHRASLNAHQDLDDPRGTALMRRNLGRTLAAQGHHENALDHYARAQEILEPRGDTYLMARLRTLRAQSLVALGQNQMHQTLAEATMEALEALRHSGEIGSHHLAAHAYEALADCAAHTGTPQQQRRLLDRAEQLYRTVWKPDADRLTARLHTQSQPSLR